MGDDRTAPEPGDPDPLDAAKAKDDPIDRVPDGDGPPPVATSESVGPDGKVAGEDGYADAHPDVNQATD